MRNFRSLLGLSIVLFGSLCMGAASADEKKPEPKPTENVTLNLSKIEVSYKADGSSGPSVDLSGQMHLASQAFVADDGTAVAFVLHANLGDASAISLDGTQRFRAIGAQDGVPVECAQWCAPPLWTFVFRLIPQGGPGPSFLVTLAVRTNYDGDGNLVNACVIGEPGCEEIGLQ